MGFELPSSRESYERLSGRRQSGLRMGSLASIQSLDDVAETYLRDGIEDAEAVAGVHFENESAESYDLSEEKRQRLRARRATAFPTIMPKDDLEAEDGDDGNKADEEDDVWKQLPMGYRIIDRGDELNKGTEEGQCCCVRDITWILRACNVL